MHTSWSHPPVASGWLIFLGLVNAYILLLWWLARSGRMEKWNLSIMLGFILMIRTQRGKGLIEKISKPKRFWNVFGDFGTVFTLIGMIFMTLGMLALLPVVLRPREDAIVFGAKEIFVIPGVNPFVPLWYGIAALIITLVVHEGGHGILARANNMKIKSLGLLYAIVPIGAFVEPDEEELLASPRRKRLRVYAAGATINIVLSLALITGFAAMVGALEPIEGQGIRSVTDESPALAAGIQPGDIITHANGSPIQDWNDFTTFMGDRVPGQNVTFIMHDGTSATATLTSRWASLEDDFKAEITAGTAEGRAYCQQVFGRDQYTTGGECARQLQADAFLGVAPFQSQLVQDGLSDPWSANFLFLVSMPIGEVRGAPYLSTYLPTFYETPFEETTYWILLNLVFWTFWINLMVGLTNILPMLPLDGGHIFRDAFGGLMAKMRPNMDTERRDRSVTRAARVISLVILTAFLLQILGPRFIN